MNSPVENFYLKWNDFDKQLSSGFSDLFRTKDLVDVTLCCEGQVAQCHKIVLAMNSIFFRKILKDNPCKHPIVIINGMNFHDLENILEFIYHGQVNVAKKDIPSFISSAELLRIDGISAQNSQVNSNSTHEKVESSPCSNSERASIGGPKPHQSTPPPSSSSNCEGDDDDQDLVIVEDNSNPTETVGTPLPFNLTHHRNENPCTNGYEPIPSHSDSSTNHLSTNQLSGKPHYPGGDWTPNPRLHNNDTPKVSSSSTFTPTHHHQHESSSSTEDPLSRPSNPGPDIILGDSSSSVGEYKLSINSVNGTFNHLKTFTTPSGMIVTSTVRPTNRASIDDNGLGPWSSTPHLLTESLMEGMHKSGISETSHFPKSSQVSTIRSTSSIPAKKRFHHEKTIPPAPPPPHPPPNIHSVSALQVVRLELERWKSGDPRRHVGGPSSLTEAAAIPSGSRQKNQKHSQVPLSVRYTTAEVDAIVDSVNKFTGPFVPCQICDKLVKRERLRAHIHECHLLQGHRIICPHCGVGLKSKGSYRVHVWRHRRANAFSMKKSKSQKTHPTGT